MASKHARAGAPDIGELEQRAEEQLQNVGRHVANLRQSWHEEMDVRNRVKDGVHAKPGAFYGAAAGGAFLTGYFLARILKA